MSNVIDYLAKQFTSPCFVKTNKYELGTILYTANPYFRTNATIIEEIIVDSVYKILTDIGNILQVEVKELQQYYLPPVCKRTSNYPELSEHFLISDDMKNFSYSLERKD